MLGVLVLLKVAYADFRHKFTDWEYALKFRLVTLD